MLVDTTVWIDFFRGKNTRQVNILAKAIQDNENIFYCGLILTEILQGISNEKQFLVIRMHFESLCYLEMSRSVHIYAAKIYRSLRNKGLTVRKTIDCLIAALAISSKLPLLHNDKDFNPIEKYCKLSCL